MNLPVTFTDQVRSGDQIGRRFDMPTANILPGEEYSTLPRGVYYSTVTVNGSQYPGITNLGVRPTVSDDNKVCAETYIYDFDKDLYGQLISVTLLEFRRPEKKFDSLDELYDTVREDFRAGKLFHGI